MEIADEQLAIRGSGVAGGRSGHRSGWSDRRRSAPEAMHDSHIAFLLKATQKTVEVANPELASASPLRNGELARMNLMENHESMLHEGQNQVLPISAMFVLLPLLDMD